MRRDDLIRVLGPIDLMTAAGARSVGSAMVRRLLGALVIGAGRAVSTERLQWALWGDDPPSSADSSIQTYVSRLRHLLGAETILRTDHSYRLDVERDQIDAIRAYEHLDTEPPPRISIAWRPSYGLTANWRASTIGPIG